MDRHNIYGTKGGEIQKEMFETIALSSKQVYSDGCPYIVGF